MADSFSGLTEVSSTIQEIVSTEIQEVLTASAVMPGSITDLSSLVGPGMNTLKVPRFGNFTVATKGENVAVDAQTNAFSTDDLALNQHKVIQWLLEDIANLQSKVAITQAYVQQAAKDLAAEMDKYVIDAMEAGVSAAGPDQKIAYNNSATTNVLAKEDFLAARKLLSQGNVPLSDRCCVISPAEEAAVLSIDTFIKVNESGNDQGLRNGQIGRLFGFDVLVSSQAEDAKSLFYHKSAIAFARQLQPRYQSHPDLANLAMRHSVDHIYGAKVLDSGKRIVLCGTA